MPVLNHCIHVTNLTHGAAALLEVPWIERQLQRLSSGPREELDEHIIETSATEFTIAAGGGPGGGAGGVGGSANSTVNVRPTRYIPVACPLRQQQAGGHATAPAQLVGHCVLHDPLLGHRAFFQFSTGKSISVDLKLHLQLVALQTRLRTEVREYVRMCVCARVRWFEHVFNRRRVPEGDSI